MCKSDVYMAGVREYFRQAEVLRSVGRMVEAGEYEDKSAACFEFAVDEYAREGNGEGDVVGVVVDQMSFCF